MKNILGVLVKNSQITRHEFEYTGIDSIYRLLDVDLIDCPTRMIGGERYTIICDDEGLFDKNNKPSFILLNENDDIIEVIVGNIFICKYNDDGEIESLTAADIKAILYNIVIVEDEDGKEYRVIRGKCYD